MPTLSQLSRELLRASLIGLCAAAAHAQTLFSDDFTTNTLPGYTIVGGTATNITYGATAGVGVGGGLIIAADTNPSTSLIPASTALTIVGGANITISAMLRSTAGGSGSRMFIGLSDQNNYAWGTGPAANSSALGASFTSANALTARRTTETGAENVGTPVTASGYAAATWYKFTATLTKPTSGITWRLTYNIQNFGADGASPGAVLASITDSPFDARGNGTGASDLSGATTATYLNFGVRNGSFDRLDNLSVTVTPPVVTAPAIVTGPWSGNLGPATVTVNAALDTSGVSVRAVASTAADFSNPLYSPAVTTASATGNTARLELAGLQPDTDYHYALEIGGTLVTDPLRVGRFRTFPVPGPASFRFGFGACGHWSEANQFVYDALAAEPIRLFLHTGDLNYRDTNSPDPQEYRNNYRDALTIGRLGVLARRHGIAYTWDDHDYSGNDSDRYSSGRLAHRQAYRELVPHYPLPDQPLAGDTHGAIYQTFTLGRVRFILTDLRSERDSVDDEDGPAKSMMGAAQKAWFKDRLREARDTEAPLIVWVSSVPFLSSDSGGENWSQYATERLEILEFVRDEKIQNIVVVSGDMHALAGDDGRGTAAYVPGVRLPIFQAAAFTRPGSIKGGPYSLGTSSGNARYGTLDVNDPATGALTVTYRGVIATSATSTTLWKQLVHTTEPVRPLAPSGLVATPNATGIALTWADLSAVETSFRVERAPAASGPWTVLATLAADSEAYQDDTAAAGVTYHYRVWATHALFDASSAPVAQATALTLLARWKLENLSDPAVADTDDRDGDGRSALHEYALGGDPLVPDQAPDWAYVLAPAAGTRYLTLSFTRYPARSDIRYLVESGADLVGWQEIARSENGAPLAGPATITGDGPGTQPRVVTVRDTLPLENPDHPRRFVRVRIER
jgi:alkaline phosphatase D